MLNIVMVVHPSGIRITLYSLWRFILDLYRGFAVARKILEQVDLENFYPVLRTRHAKSQEQNSSVTGISPILSNIYFTSPCVGSMN